MSDTKLVVMFDTSVARNEDLKDFYGLSDTWKGISNMKNVKLCIPQMVVDEIKAQKIRKFNKDKKESEKNINERINQLLKRENYIIIDIKNTDILYEMYELAVNYKPPFEKHDDFKISETEKRKKGRGDKGFKDAYIYFTILEYANNNPNDKILFYVNDNRLLEAFDNLKNWNNGNRYTAKKFEKNKIIQEINDKTVICKEEEIKI